MATNRSAVAKVLEALEGLDVASRYVFNGDCLYCDAKPVGWISADRFYLKNTGKHLPSTERFPLERTACKPLPSFVIPESEYGTALFRQLIQETADALPASEKRWPHKDSPPRR